MEIIDRIATGLIALRTGVVRDERVVAELEQRGLVDHSPSPTELGEKPGHHLREFDRKAADGRGFGVNDRVRPRLGPRSSFSAGSVYAPQLPHWPQLHASGPRAA